MTTTPASRPVIRTIVCARCGTPFQCGPTGDCWCTYENVRLPMPTDAAEDCLCRACLRKAADERPHNPG